MFMWLTEEMITGPTEVLDFALFKSSVELQEQDNGSSSSETKDQELNAKTWS